MRHLSRIAAVAAASLAALTVAPVEGVSASPQLAPGNATPEGMIHWVGQFDLRMERDLDHYAGWVLQEVGVSAQQRSARYPCGDPRCWRLDHLGMVWLFLTPGEAEDANRLIGQEPLIGAEVSEMVGVPEDPLGVPGDTPASSGAVIEPGSDRQFVPTGARRIGVPVEQWDADRRAPSMRNAGRFAMIDTGVDARHPDLYVVDGLNCSLDEYGVDGWGHDWHGHGTFGSGLATADHNDIGIVGPAPGAPVFDAKVFPRDMPGASTAMVLCGLNAALAGGATVINASLGGNHVASRCGGPSVYTNAWCIASTQAIVVVSAGNDANNAIHKGPANVPGLLTIGAIADFDGEPGALAHGFPGCGFTHRDDHLAFFSNWGEVVDAVAPGTCLMSLIPGERLANGGSGTSYSSPYAAGIIFNFQARYGCEGDRAVTAVLNYAKRDVFAEDGYTGWPTGDPPPLLMYVVEDPEETYRVDADPCRIPRAA